MGSEFDMPMRSNSKTNQVTIETIRKAIMGANIANSGELHAHYGGIPHECIDAAKVIQDNYAEFEKLLWDRISALPLVQKLFGHLIRVRSKQKGFLASPIVSAIFDDPRRLEHRLENTHNTPAFQTIVQEIGHIKNPVEWDRRFLDAWAEIRVIDQLMREKFTDICKVTTPADLVAKYAKQPYAIQVTRISRDPQFPDLPTGDLQRIYGKISGSVGLYFWDSIERKNLKFKDVPPLEYVRRIAIVTSTYRLQDSLNRHIACQQVRDSILAFERCYFEEIQWLLDNGNGAIFRVEISDEGAKVRCWVDWGDDPADPRRGNYDDCRWREVDLDSVILPAYK
jgi:hypothetical protein